MTAIIDVRLLHSRCCMISQLVGMCGIDFLFQFGFGSFFLKLGFGSKCVWFSSVQKNAVWFGYYSYLLNSCNS